MNIYETCNLCMENSKFKHSTEIVEVNSNVRLFQNDKFIVWRCPSCKTIHSKDGVDLSYYYKHYPIHNIKLDPLVKMALSKRLKRLKRTGFNTKHRLLDFGCGSGIMISFLKNLGYNNVKGYDEFNADFSDKSTLNEQYDYIACQDVIEHAPDPRDLLSQVVNLLKTGGILSIGTPNADAIDLRDPEYYRMPLHQPYHRHILSEKTIVSIAEEMNLTPVISYHRYYLEFLLPFMNQKFCTEYFIRKDNVLENTLKDKIDYSVALTPKMLFFAFFGFFFSPKTEMEILFKKTG